MVVGQLVMLCGKNLAVNQTERGRRWSVGKSRELRRGKTPTWWELNSATMEEPKSEHDTGEDSSKGAHVKI